VRTALAPRRHSPSNGGTFFGPLPIRPHDSTRNDRIRFTLTRPEPHLLVFGLSYFDKTGRGPNEGLFEFDLDARTVTAHYRGKYPDPRYGDYHHGDKRYLTDAG
jgi:hypothetical protein